MSADSSSDSFDVTHLLGIHPTSAQLISYLLKLSQKALGASTQPEVKSYPDAVYFNYYQFGLSLLFKPVNGYKPTTGLNNAQLQHANLVLDGIDIYNVLPPKEGATSRQTKPAYKSYPLKTLTLNLASIAGKERPGSVTVKPDTTGKDFVSCMGEPDRKGGGAGPSTGSIGIWCEWSKDGVMVEFGGEEARGPKAWETGKDAAWSVISIFPLKES
ncbi:hypothetical protein NM688_g9100 [Phlebia brevispora]|uniref:Uncharacterized protein n=1 Tax=Phlebia brevispora TaxID=194682 RepID=A0ACC1RM03_9APHY|nr:hypothetical protein NM688_g9100 [Phlebia brevispora]